MVVQEAISPEEGNRAPSKHEKKHRLKQRFEVVKKLGQGTYGKVQLAINKETNQEVAIKTIKKSKIESEQDLIRIRREIQIMSSIQHPHIIHIYEVFENKEKIVLIMQYASGGELYDYLSEKKILNDVEARRIFRQIAAAVYYCHKNKICHRDLKLENVLLDEKGNAKIADFGLSNVYDEKHLLDTFCGSPLYASPEIVKGVPYYGPEVDCWSMGVILYTLVYGAMPFDGSNFKRLVKQISEGDYYEPTKKAEASQLINRLLHVNPAKRATIIDICTDWWVNEGYEHSLLQVSEDLANLTPVRIDLLVALAPASSAPQGKDTQNPLASSNDNKSCPKLPEEEANRNEDDAETITDSFTFLDGRTDSHRSASFPNLPNLDETDDEFIPAGLAAELDGQYSKRQAEQSFDGSLIKVSSIAHKTKKPRKSSSIDKTQMEENKVSIQQDHNANVQPENVNKDQNNNDPRSDTTNEILDQAKENPSTNTETKENSKASKVTQEESNKVEKSPKQKKSKQVKGSNTEKVTEQNEENKCTEKRRQSTELNEEKVSIPGGRKPGKIAIPKFLESPETSPTKTAENILLSQVNEKSESKIKKSEEKDQKKQNSLAEEQNKKQTEDEIKNTHTTGQSEEKCQNINETSVTSTENDKSTNSEAKKVTAKGILKKNIAKARLLEKRLSQQSSVESEGTPSSPTGQSNTSPPLTGESHDVSKGPSFFKVPQPYSKNINDKPVQSKAEIVITSSKNENSPQSESPSHHEETESIWGTPLSPPVKSNKQNQIVQKHVEWDTSADIEQNSNNWKEQVGQSLMRLCPEEADDDEFGCTKHMGPTPITRSYKKFTFTKEGTCITETGKIYTKPGADGSWTKVEKKTKITTLPGNDEFQKFEHVQVRDESSLARSDSQSSSGSNDIFDDIFDSWTGDSMLCNFLKVKDNIKKFSRGPLLWRDRHRDPFKHFNKPTQKPKDMQSGEWEASDNDEDFDIHFDDMHPVVYGSQGLWQLLMSVNKDLPHHLRNFREPPQLGGFTRSISRDRGAGLLKKQNQYSSRASSGYGTRSLSRERSQSPRERVLKFVVESPQRQQSVGSNEPVSSPSQDLWYSRTPTSDTPERRCRKDSGVESCTSAESEVIHQSAPQRFSSRDEGARCSSFDDTFGPRTYKQYVKSFSKDTSSDRQNSLEEQYPQSPFDNLTDSRRHRVEQWLHMTDIDDFDSPFEEFARHHEVFSRSESPKASLYGTMRPRSFMKYNRSVSDKLTDADSPFIPNLQENQYNQGIEGQNNRSYRSEISVDSTGNVQSSTFKTVSGADYVTSRIPMHSHSGTSFHAQQCDSDGNTHKQYTTSSQQNSPHSTKYTRSFSGNLQFGPQEGGISSRGPNRPILSMTVSFNRGGSDGPVIVQSNTPRQHSVNTGGLWQQQEFSSGPGRITIRREFSDPTSESPHINTVPTQRYYSTQETDRGPASSFSQPRGKVNHSLTCTDTACSEWCMIKNNNFHSFQNSELCHLQQFEQKNAFFKLGIIDENSVDTTSDGTLTPDSLETSSLKDELEQKQANIKQQTNNTQLDFNSGIWQLSQICNDETMKTVGTEYRNQLLITERNEVTVRLHSQNHETVSPINMPFMNDKSSQCKI